MHEPLRPATRSWRDRLPGPIAAGAGAVAALGLPPWGWWPLTLGGFALLLLVLHRNGPGRAFGIGWAFGFLWFVVGLGWLAQAFTFQSAMPVSMGHVAHLGLAAFLALYWGLASLLARSLAKAPLALAVALAGALLLAELLRGWLFTGFPWNPPGLVLLPIPGIRDAAAIIGADGLSALLLLASGTLALAALRRWREAAIALSLALLLALPGLFRLGATPAPPPPGLLLLVQPNSSQADKHGANGTERHLVSHIRETEAALDAMTPADRARLAAVVWPEGAIEFPLEETPWLRTLVTRSLPPQAHLVAGTIAVERDPRGEAIGLRNSMSLLDATGRILHRYDKAHLVPGGEFLPLRPLAERLGLQRLVPGTLDFWPGPGPETIALQGLPAMAAAICYEIIFPGRVVDRRNRPDVILTVSSDAWFGPSGPPQHFAQARLRAIEEGLPVVRVTPTGITGVISARGVVEASLPADAAGHLLVTTPGALPPTPFARFGLWLPLLLGLLLLAAAAALNGKMT
ncbi:apolipoprotein N-acyltransferase [Thermaurantiacus sp.]